MSEYISREEIDRVLSNRISMNDKCLSGAKENKQFEEEKYFFTLIFEDEQIKDLIEGLPPADVRPNIHGHWEDDNYGHIICTACKGASPSMWKSRFCPMCGADMREKENLCDTCTRTECTMRALGKEKCIICKMYVKADRETKGEKGD